MEFKLTKVVFKNIKAKNKEGKEFTVAVFYIEHDGLPPIAIVPKDKKDYSKLEYLAEKKFSDYIPQTKDNSGDLLK